MRGDEKNGREERGEVSLCVREREREKEEMRRRDKGIIF